MSRGNIKNKMNGLILAALAVAAAAQGVSAAVTDPTPQEIATNWATLSGGKGGMVVYNTGAEMWIMNLKTGESKKLINYPQAKFSFSAEWGQSSGYKISPNGKRIAAQNGTGVMVLNIDGSNPKIIWSGVPTGDQISLSWDGDDKVVYSSCKAGTKPFTISSTTVNADNSAGATEVLWDTSKDPAPSGSSYGGASGLVSINKNGDYLSFDIMTDGPNIPIVVKVSTKEGKAPTKGGDGCQIRMWPDGSGTVSYHVNTHLANATLYNFAQGKTVGTVPQPTADMGACGNGGFNWAYDPNFLISTGDNDAKHSPGCISTARIRSTKDWTKYMILGKTVFWPDLWIGDATSDVKTSSKPAWNGSVRMAGSLLSINAFAGEISDVKVMNLRGAVVASGEKMSATMQNVEMSALPVGSYVLSWKQGAQSLSRHVNVLSGASAQVVISQ